MGLVDIAGGAICFLQYVKIFPLQQQRVYQ
jgi:hypothetical protein